MTADLSSLAITAGEPSDAEIVAVTVAVLTALTQNGYEPIDGPEQPPMWLDAETYQPPGAWTTR